MSVRATDAVEGASRFSLRNMFAGFASEEDLRPTASQPQQAVYAPQQQAAVVIKSRSVVSPPLNVAPMPMLPMQTGGSIKFSLPELKNAPARQPTTITSLSTKSLAPGYLSGGGGASESEVLRLSGAVEDLTQKLKKATEKLATTEQSVLRGNKCIQKERHLAHARIIALQSEVRAASEREAAVRIELAAIPKQTDLDAERFRIQSEGALELEAQFEKEKELRIQAEASLAQELENAAQVKRSLEALEGERDALKATHEALQLSHTTACEKLEKAMQSNAHDTAKQLSENLEVQTGKVVELQKQVDDLKGLLEKNVEEPVTDSKVKVAEGADDRSDAAIGVTLATLKSQLISTEKRLAEATSAATLAKQESDIKELASTRLIEELDAKLAFSREEVRRANATRDALRGIEEITKQIDQLDVAQTGCGCGIDLPSPKGAPAEEGQEEEKKKEGQQEEEKPCDCDDKNETRPECDCPPITATPTSVLQPEHKLLWDAHHAARVEADEATNIAMESPNDHALAAYAARKRMQAMRTHKALFGLSDRPSVRCCVKESVQDEQDASLDSIVCDKDEIRQEMHCAINATLGQFGVASIAIDHADVDLIGVPVSGKRQRQVLKNNGAANVAKQERTTALIQALTTDLKTNFTDLNAQWSAALQMDKPTTGT